MEDELNEQQENSKGSHLKPWQFKPGQSGNPAGRPPGRSLKDFAKAYLSGMTDDERIAFFEGIDKKTIWEMAEGKPDTKTDITTNGKELPTPIIKLDALPRNNSTEENSESH